MTPSSDLPGDFVHTAHFLYGYRSGNRFKDALLRFEVQLGYPLNCLSNSSLFLSIASATPSTNKSTKRIT